MQSITRHYGSVEMTDTLVGLESADLARQFEQRRKDAEKDLKDGKVKGVTIREHRRIGRNDPCPCGSGKKFKKCCGSRLAKDDERIGQ